MELVWSVPPLTKISESVRYLDPHPAQHSKTPVAEYNLDQERRDCCIPHLRAHTTPTNQALPTL